MEQASFIYYRRRAAEERGEAERASCIQAAQAHRQMADHYARRAKQEAAMVPGVELPMVAND